MKSNIIFFTVLLFVSCSIDKLDSNIDLENVPEFIQLTNSPISKVVLSAISLRMEESTTQNAGFAKVMALINELIHDNRNQLQTIKKLNQRVVGQCLVSNNKLQNRAHSFESLLQYFRNRAHHSIALKGESLNIRNSRKRQGEFYSNAAKRFSLTHSNREGKWKQRVVVLKQALDHVNTAIKAINEWTPKSPSFIEEHLKMSVDKYTQVKRIPLNFDSDMIQLAASDAKTRKRLFEWATLLKAAIIDSLSFAQTTTNEINSNHSKLNNNLNDLVAQLKRDEANLKKQVEDWGIMIDNYVQNEKIYAKLAVQTSIILKGNQNWCNVENVNFKTNKILMQQQLDVFVQLKQWFRKKFL